MSDIKKTEIERFDCNTDCSQCKYKRTIKAQDGWEFTGCYHAPYKGKMLAEIKECPKTKDEKIQEIIERKEKVVKGLECCMYNQGIPYYCDSCPYHIVKHYCKTVLMKEACLVIKNLGESEK